MSTLGNISKNIGKTVGKRALSGALGGFGLSYLSEPILNSAKSSSSGNNYKSPSQQRTSSKSSYQQPKSNNQPQKNPYDRTSPKDVKDITAAISVSTTQILSSIDRLSTVVSDGFEGITNEYSHSSEQMKERLDRIATILGNSHQQQNGGSASSRSAPGQNTMGSGGGKGGSLLGKVVGGAAAVVAGGAALAWPTSAKADTPKPPPSISPSQKPSIVPGQNPASVVQQPKNQTEQNLQSNERQREPSSPVKKIKGRTIHLTAQKIVFAADKVSGLKVDEDAGGGSGNIRYNRGQGGSGGGPGGFGGGGNYLNGGNGGDNSSGGNGRDTSNGRDNGTNPPPGPPPFGADPKTGKYPGYQDQGRTTTQTPKWSDGKEATSWPGGQPAWPSSAPSGPGPNMSGPGGQPPWLSGGGGAGGYQDPSGTGRFGTNFTGASGFNRNFSMTPGTSYTPGLRSPGSASLPVGTPDTQIGRSGSFTPGSPNISQSTKFTPGPAGAVPPSSGGAGSPSNGPSSAAGYFQGAAPGTTGTRQDIPYGGVAAPIRYNNPGGSWPKSDIMNPYGLSTWGKLQDGNSIAKAPTVAHGVAYNMAFFKSKNPVGHSIGEMRNLWVTGKWGGMKSLPGAPGGDHHVITAEDLKNPEFMKGWMTATAKAEGFHNGKISDDDLASGYKMYEHGGQFTPEEIKKQQEQGGGGQTTPGSNTTGGQAGGGQPADKKKLIFMHGLWDRYKDAQGKPIPPEKIEAQAKAYAEKKGMEFVPIHIDGRDRKNVQKALQEQLKQGGVGEVVGFSAGADLLKKTDLPDGVKKTTIGATSDFKATGGDPNYPNVKHMDLPGALADQQPQLQPQGGGDQQQVSNKILKTTPETSAAGSSVPALGSDLMNPNSTLGGKNLSGGGNTAADKNPQPLPETRGGGKFGGNNDAPNPDKANTNGRYDAGLRLTHQHGNQDIDPRLMKAAQEASKDLPPGWHAEMVSGKDARKKTQNHPNKIAMDIKIYRPDGSQVAFNDAIHPKDAKMYEQFGQSMRMRGQKMFPGTNWLWGGTWQGGGAPVNGDPMHMQLFKKGVGSQGMNQYNWDKGVLNHNAFPNLMKPGELKSYQEQVKQNMQNEDTPPAPINDAKVKQAEPQDSILGNEKGDTTGANFKGAADPDATPEGDVGVGEIKPAGDDPDAAALAPADKSPTPEAPPDSQPPSKPGDDTPAAPSPPAESSTNNPAQTQDVPATSPAKDGQQDNVKGMGNDGMKQSGQNGGS